MFLLRYAEGHTEYFRGLPVKTRLLPKVQVDIVVLQDTVETVVDTVKKALYTGNMGDERSSSMMLKTL